MPLARADETSLFYSLEIKGRREISRLAIDRLERAIIGGLTRPRCSVKLAGPKDPEDLAVVLDLEYWRERTLPGGRPVLDRRSGREKPGRIRKIEARYSVAVFAPPNRKKPAYEKKRQVAKQVGTTGNPLFSPEEEVYTRIAKVLSRDIEKALCKASDK